MHKKYIYIHHFGIAEDILGPGKRVVIWTTGCPFKCKGCIEEDLQQIESGTKYEINELLHILFPFINKLKAITFSGGEPLYQKELLLHFLKLIPKDIDIMLYTGHKLSDFLINYKEFTPYIDICITDPFISTLHGNYLWRGSKNQQIISPSGKYNKKQLKEWMDAESKGINLHVVDNNYFIYGIPAPNILNKIEKILEKNGIDN